MRKANPTPPDEIDQAEIKEPILCCPNDPGHAKQLSAKPLSQVAGVKIDEVFIGSCVTNIGHFRAAGKLLGKVEGGSLATRLWIAPPTRMDEHQLMEEGSQHLRQAAAAEAGAPPDMSLTTYALNTILTA